MKNFLKSLSLFLAVLFMFTATPAFAATLEGSDLFSTREIEIEVDGGGRYLYYVAKEAHSSRNTPFVDIRDVARDFGYQVEYMTAGQYYWCPPRGEYQWLEKDTYVILENTSWDDSRTQIRRDTKNRNLTFKTINVWDAYNDTWANYSVYEVKSRGNGAGFLVSVYDLPSIFPESIARVERIFDADDQFTLTTTNTQSSAGTSVVQRRYKIQITVDGEGSSRTWNASDFKYGDTPYVDVREVARSLGYQVEFKKADRWYLDPLTGQHEWLYCDTYIILTDTNWNNSRSNMRTDVRSQDALAPRSVQIWQPYQSTWRWLNVNEINSTANGGGFMISIYDLPLFFPDVDKVEAIRNSTTRFRITTE